MLYVFLTLVAMGVLAVLGLIWAGIDKSDKAFKTQGHKSSEFKKTALGILILLVGMWTGLYGIWLIPQPDNNAYVLVVEQVNRFNIVAAICITVLISVYTVCRTWLKSRVHK